MTLVVTPTELTTSRSHLLPRPTGITRQMVSSRAAMPLAGAPTLIEALPEPVNMALYRGDDFAFQLTVTNPDGSAADLTGETATSQMRVTADTADPPAGHFDCTIATNVITVVLANAVSKLLPAALVWDLQLTSGTGSIRTLVAGTISVTPDVTRP